MNIIVNVFSFFSSFLQNISDSKKYLQSCEDEGRNASAQGIASDANPYPKESKEHSAWESGHSNWIW